VLFGVKLFNIIIHNKKVACSDRSRDTELEYDRPLLIVLASSENLCRALSGAVGVDIKQ